MARSQSLLKLYAILLFGAFFSLFLQNAVAAPITAIGRSYKPLAGPEALYKRDEAEFEDFQDVVQVKATDVEFAATQDDESTSLIGDINKVLHHDPPKIVKVPPKIIIPKGKKGKGKEKAAPSPLPSPVYPNIGQCEAAIALHGKATVFYSNAQPRDAAYKFSQSPGVNGVILNNALPKLFLKKKTNVNDPGDKLYNEFLDRASVALAKKSSGTVYFVTSKAGPMADRIWKRLEEPALHANPAVTRIVKVDSEDFAKQDHDFWVRH